MTKHYSRAVLLLAALIFVGCGRTTVDVPENTDIRLGDKVDFDVADWLTKPRADLAKLCDEWTETVEAESRKLKNRQITENGGLRTEDRAYRVSIRAD